MDSVISSIQKRIKLHIFYLTIKKVLVCNLHTYEHTYVQTQRPTLGVKITTFGWGNVGLVGHCFGRFMTRKSRIEMKDDRRNGNNQKFGKHLACHKIHHTGSILHSVPH